MAEGHFVHPALGLGDAEGDLGGVEKLSAFFLWNGADEDAVGGAGYEVAGTPVADEQGHGVAIGLACQLGPPEVIRWPLQVVFFHVSLECAFPSSAAAADGDCGARGMMVGDRPDAGVGGDIFHCGLHCFFNL